MACVWRRQTFSAAVDSCSPEMSAILLQDSLPELLALISDGNNVVPPALVSILDAAFSFSRMLHSSKTGIGGKADAFYKAFVPDLGTPLDPRQVELVKRCLRAERGEMDQVGSCIFPGIVKITGGSNEPTTQTVMKRALVMCECALGLSDHFMAAAGGGMQQQAGYALGPQTASPPPSHFSSPQPLAVNLANGHPGLSQSPYPRPMSNTGNGNGVQYPVDDMEGMTLVQARS